MTVFMGPRTNYLVYRYKIHSICAILAGILAVLGIGVCFSSPSRMVGLMPAVAVLSKKGRKIYGQCVKEVHDGILYEFTGVFHTDKKSTGRE